jgi:hypothetical protein
MDETNAFSISQLQQSSLVGMSQLKPGQLSSKKIKSIQANNQRNRKYAFLFHSIFSGNKLSTTP